MGSDGGVRCVKSSLPAVGVQYDHEDSIGKCSIRDQEIVAQELLRQCAAPTAAMHTMRPSNIQRIHPCAAGELFSTVRLPPPPLSKPRSRSCWQRLQAPLLTTQRRPSGLRSERSEWRA